MLVPPIGGTWKGSLQVFSGLICSTSCTGGICNVQKAEQSQFGFVLYWMFGKGDHSPVKGFKELRKMLYEVELFDFFFFT